MPQFNTGYSAAVPQNYAMPAYPQMNQQMVPQQQSYSQQFGLSIAQIDNPSQVDNYPVAANNTVLLIDFTHKVFYLKSTNVNGVPMPIQIADWDYRPQPQQTAQVSPNQNDGNAVSRQEFDELKAMLAQALSASQANNHVNQNSRYNGSKRGGNQNGQSGNDPANNG